MGTPEESERIAPGQSLTAKFPVTGERSAGVALTEADWKLTIQGEVEASATLGFKQLLALPQERFTMDIHCVTGWTRLGTVFEGVRLRSLIDACVSVRRTASFVHFAAYSQRLHDTSLPLQVALEDSWLVHRYDGKPLEPEHGYPVRVVTTSRYFYKSLKWLKEITLLSEDRLGFWERTSGYHNNANPWKQERYDGRRFTSAAEAEAFKAQREFSHHRGDVILHASFVRWEPKTKDLRGVQLKASDFREAQLDGVDFSGANLTRSRFAGADLRHTNFTGADLEGADFSGAHLAGAVFDQNHLSATVFHKLASHEGLSITNPIGLLEIQEAYLREIGALKS